MKKLIILISALILCAPLLTCSDTGQTVDLKIYYSAAGFTGFYVADSGSFVLIDVGTPAGTDSGVYEKTITMTTSLKVQITSKSKTNFITVMVYKDSLIVKEGTSTGDSVTAASVELLYEYDPAKKETETTTK